MHAKGDSARLTSSPTTLPWPGVEPGTCRQNWPAGLPVELPRLLNWERQLAVTRLQTYCLVTLWPRFLNYLHEKWISLLLELSSGFIYYLNELERSRLASLFHSAFVFVTRSSSSLSSSMAAWCTGHCQTVWGQVWLTNELYDGSSRAL